MIRYFKSPVFNQQVDQDSPVIRGLVSLWVPARSLEDAIHAVTRSRSQPVRPSQVQLLHDGYEYLDVQLADYIRDIEMMSYSGKHVMVHVPESHSHLQISVAVKQGTIMATSNKGMRHFLVIHRPCQVGRDSRELFEVCAREICASREASWQSTASTIQVHHLHWEYFSVKETARGWLFPSTKTTTANRK